MSFLEDGIYRIENLETQQCLTNNTPSSDNKIPIYLSPFNNDSAHWWHVQPSGIHVGAGGSPLSWIVNVATGVYLNASDQAVSNPAGYRAVGARGVLDGNQQPQYQAWSFNQISGKPNQYTIENSKQSGCVLDVGGNNGGEAIAATKSGAKHQTWRLVKIYPS